MPFAMCCSPNAAVSISEDAGRVVENGRRGVGACRGRVGTRLRGADKQRLDIVAAFIMYRGDCAAAFDCRVGQSGGVRVEAA